MSTPELIDLCVYAGTHASAYEEKCGPLFQIMAGTGCRWNEAMEFNTWAYDPGTGQYEYRTSKSLVIRRVVPIMFVDELYEIWSSQAYNFADKSYSGYCAAWLWTIAPNRLYLVQKEIQMHTFRHMYARYLSTHGYSIPMIQTNMAISAGVAGHYVNDAITMI